MASPRSDVELSGPFFTKDVRKTVRQNIMDLMDGLAAEMERDVRSKIAGKETKGAMPYSTGWTRRHVIGRTRSVRGRRWQTWARVSVNTQGMTRRQAIRTKAAGASIERRWHIFRRETFRGRRIAKKAYADLTRGLD